MLDALGIDITPTVTAGSILVIVVLAIGSAVVARIKTRPAVLTAENEAAAISNAEVAARLKEFRVEVHGLRNELGTVRSELHHSQNQSARRGDKLNMLRFILQMVLDELASKDKGNKVLAQARNLLSRVEDEPGQPGNSDVLQAAEDAHEATGATVQEIKAEEAKE